MDFDIDLTDHDLIGDELIDLEDCLEKKCFQEGASWGHLESILCEHLEEKERIDGSSVMISSLLTKNK
ncbi:MAG: hypothetical protein ACOCQ4_02360 [bacterium]